MTQKKRFYPSKSVNIEPDVHKQLTEYSIINGIRIGHYVSSAILEKLARERKTEKVMEGFPIQRFTGYISEKDLDIDLDTGND